MRHRTLPLLLACTAALSGCKAPDPKAELEVLSVETYWAIDSGTGSTSFLAPVVRLQVRNKAAEPRRSIQATATFRRVGEEHLTWGSAWTQVSGGRSPGLDAGATALVVLKSDGRYSSPDRPETLFGHAQWKDARAEVFLRVGSSGWVAFGTHPIERRIGTREVLPLGTPDPSLPLPPPVRPSPAASGPGSPPPSGTR